MTSIWKIHPGTFRQRETKVSHSHKEKIFLALGIFAFSLLAMPFATIDLAARSTPTGFTAPPLLGGRGAVDTCNIGLIGACNDSGQYVSGPESILDTWIFSEGIPWWISYFLVLAAGVAVLVIMIGGSMITVGADSDIRKKGVKAIIWALLGLGIALFAFVIISILENLPLPGSTAPAPKASVTSLVS